MKYAALALVYLVYTVGFGAYQFRENRRGSDPKYHTPVWWVMLAWPGLLVWVLIARLRTLVHSSASPVRPSADDAATKAAIVAMIIQNGREGGQSATRTAYEILHQLGIAPTPQRADFTVPDGQGPLVTMGMSEGGVG